MQRRIAIAGAAGQVGRELVRVFASAGDEVLSLVRPEFELTDASTVRRLADWRPDVVVNSAAWTDVDGCARDPQRALLVNGHGAGLLALAAADAGALVVQISTNEVFDGTLGRAYREEDEPNPINPYGAAKLAGERLVADSNPCHVIVRTAWIYSPDSGFPSKIRSAADAAVQRRAPLRVVEDEWGNPTPAGWLAGAIKRITALALSDDLPDRILHAAGGPPCTRLAWAQHVLRDHPVAVEPVRLEDFHRDSRVPPRAVLDTSRIAKVAIRPPDWRVPSGHLIGP